MITLRPMPGATLDQLLIAERELQAAQLASDVGGLDALVHDNCEMFIGPDTQLHGKSEDLAFHREGVTKFLESKELEMNAQVIAGAGVSSALLALKVDVAGEIVEGNYRYVRAWVFDDGRWQIIGGAVVAAAG